MAIEEWEIWACGQMVLRQHGAKARTHATGRAAALAAAGDPEGCRTWQRISDRIRELERLTPEGMLH